MYTCTQKGWKYSVDATCFPICLLILLRCWSTRSVSDHIDDSSLHNISFTASIGSPGTDSNDDDNGDDDECLWQVATDVDVGKVYKVRVGFHGDGKETQWYSNFAHSPSWYLERVRLPLFCFFLWYYCVRIPSLFFLHLHLHLFLNQGGHWGTTDDLATSFLNFSLFSTAL